MKLRGIKPKLIEKRFKAFFYGKAGVGKTTAAIQFPKPYLIDTERGAENSEYVKILEKSGGSIFQTLEFDELLNEVKSLLTNKHEYKTLIIDPLTTLYNNLVDNCANKFGSKFGRHYTEANRILKPLFNYLLRLDMNIIITSHSKNEYATEMVVLGQTFDCYKNIDYIFDFICEIQKRGADRVGIVKKSRINSFQDGEQFPFSYEAIADRYGRDILERDSVPEVLATSQQVVLLNKLIELLKIPPELQEKWLTKAGADKFDDMPGVSIQACIDSLNKKLEGLQSSSSEIYK